MKISFPEALPVSQRRQEIEDALRDHAVVIVCGDTGSGKTTQLPKIALELGRGREGKRIGCTQPRRIAATSVARRVAEELQVPLGKEVGYQIRFEDRTDRKATAVKFMTDGVLLAETRHDPDWRQYDTLIIDEAHERSLNIDFILGYLQRTLERRRDLKVVISSATLDAGAFASFFGGAPVVEVAGRTFPVEDRYQPPREDREPLAEQVARAVEELGSEDRFGDTLVFLPGEREIRNAADLLAGRNYPDTLILPLFGRQAGSDQDVVFRPVKTKRRVILATNVAETSLTIPGIRFVVDSGLARVSRHDAGSGIQRLQVEEISRASARQRRGRCGRVSKGVCVRLYDEEDFESRDEFTDPEILRSHLAGVVLQMESLGLGDPLEFPFVDPPPPRRVSQAYRVLEEIGAIRKKGKSIELTTVGKTLSRLPVDPRVGRILVAAREEDCLLEGLVIASVISVQDPRERPREKQEAADEAHRRFRDKRSDFTSWLRWWFAIGEARKKSNNQLRRFCQKNFLNYRRVQEWLNLHRELRDTLREMKWKLPPPSKRITDPEDTYSEPLHRAILAAIPSQIGLHQGTRKGYRGARQSTFFLFPGSGIFGSAPSWVMAFEMVETAKLYARNTAMFDPGWFEKVAPHLCRYRYSNPHWVKEQGAVYGEERVMAFGLPVVEKRNVHYGRIDAKVAREVFLLEALVNGNTKAPLPALADNVETMRAAERLEHKMRRLGGLLHPESIVSFYEERLPARIHTQKAFEKWVGEEGSEIIRLELEDCLLPQREPIRFEDFPDTILSPDGETEFVVTYLHAPADSEDGITALIPLVELPHLSGWFGEWLVPGWIEEKASALLRCLPKELRALLPASREVVEGFLDSWEGYEPDCGIVEATIDHLESSYGVEVSEESFDLERIPQHLQMRFAIVDDDDHIVGTSRDLRTLQEELAVKVRARFRKVSTGKFEKSSLTRWSFGSLPESVELDRHTTGYPRLFDEGQGQAGMRLFESASCAELQHRLGLARLFQSTRSEMMARLEGVLASTPPLSSPPPQGKLKERKGEGFGSLAAAFEDGSIAVSTKPSAGSGAPPRSTCDGTSCSSLAYLNPLEGRLLDQIGPAPSRNRWDLVSRVVGEEMGLPLDAEGFEVDAVRLEQQLFEKVAAECSRVSKLLPVIERVGAFLETAETGYEESIEDAREHYARLLAPGWLLVGDLPRRLWHWQGLEMRLTRLFGSPPGKDFSKLERYRDEARDVWSVETSCVCGRCPEAIACKAQIEADLNLRLKVFAPEIRARLK
ncbi:MAG: ATP-dependent RNA helicase HrpA [Verrucomicrobiota bacterium]